MRCSIGLGSAFPEKIGGAAQLNGELASMMSSTAPRDSRCPDALNDLDDSSIYTDVQHPFKLFSHPVATGRASAHRYDDSQLQHDCLDRTRRFLDGL